MNNWGNGILDPWSHLKMAPVFFVGKKNSEKRRVQNYRYLNKWTIKNNHPLPLILNIVENIGTKKVFTKLNLW